MGISSYYFKNLEGRIIHNNYWDAHITSDNQGRDLNYATSKKDNSNKKVNTYINGGFFVISKNAIKKIKKNSTYWEKEPMTYFIKKKKLFAFKHNGFWKSLDTLKDKNDFNLMIKNKNKPWVI